MPRGNAPSRVDANQREIIAFFRMAGATVTLLHSVGKGCPDAIVGLNMINALVEIKDGSQVPSKQKLTEPEQKFFDNWLGFACIVRNLNDAAALIYAMRQENVGESMLQRGFNCTRNARNELLCMR